MKTPSLAKAIEADYLAWFCVVVPVVLWFFYLFLVLTEVGGPNAVNLWSTILLITLVGALGLALRFNALRSHFARGVEVGGVIERYMHLQDLGRVIYTYTYLKKEYRTTNYIHHSTRTMKIESMSVVKVVVNPSKPQAALIKDLYFSPEER